MVVVMAVAMVATSHGASSGGDIGGTSGGIGDGGACNDSGSGSVDSDGRWHEDGSVGKICTLTSFSRKFITWDFNSKFHEFFYI